MSGSSTIPEAQPGSTSRRCCKEALGLVSAAAKGASASGDAPPLPMRELPRYPLIVPERVHTMRRLLETQAALAGIKLDIAWEVSSVPSIIDLVCAGYGHAVLTASGVAASAAARRTDDADPGRSATVTVLCVVSAAQAADAAGAHDDASCWRRWSARCWAERLSRGRRICRHTGR